MKVFDTEAEANTYIEELNTSRAKITCPLMGGSCVLTCECYSVPSITTESYSHMGKFVVVGGFCTCYMLKGPE